MDPLSITSGVAGITGLLVQQSLELLKLSKDEPIQRELSSILYRAQRYIDILKEAYPLLGYERAQASQPPETIITIDQLLQESDKKIEAWVKDLTLLHEHRKPLEKLRSAAKDGKLQAIQAGLYIQTALLAARVLELRQINPGADALAPEIPAVLERPVIAVAPYHRSQTSVWKVDVCTALYIAYILGGFSSLVTALLWTILKNDAGGGFTIGAYIVGLSTVVVKAIQSMHDKVCRCTPRRRAREDEHEMD